MDYKRYDIVVMPPCVIAEQAIATSQALAPLGTFFVLDDEVHHPHLSLYHVPLNESSLAQVRERLAALSSVTKPFLLKQETYYPDQGVWVGVRYVADQAILNLHTAVIAATKDYRVIEDDIRYKARWADLDPKRRQHIQECGWADAFASYFPHLTFTKLREPRADIFAHLPQPEYSFLVDRIGIYQLGEHGTAATLVADFSLSA